MNWTNCSTTRIAVFAAITLFGRPVNGTAAPGGAVPGEQRRWTLEFKVRLDQPGGERPVEIDIAGNWVSTISAVRPGEYDTAIEVANARIKGDRVRSTPVEATAELERRLTRRFWATYRDDGALLAVHFFKDVNPSDRNLLQMIATEMQLVRPDSKQTVWTVLERDGGGNYLAIYERPEWSTVLKRKLKYVSTDDALDVRPNGLHVEVDQSELRYAVDGDGGIVALDGTNRVRMGVSLRDTGQLSAITEMHLGNLRKSHVPELIGSLRRELRNVESSPIVTHKPDPVQVRAQRDERLLDGRTTESLLEAAMAKDNDPTLPNRLAALFRRRPDAIVAALELVRKNGAQKRITDALGSAGTPEAMEALGSLARDRSASSTVRSNALASFILVQHPDLEAMRIPADLLDDDDAKVVSAARITSGALARAGRDRHPAEADAIDIALIARFRKTRDVGGLVDLLAALGNSAGPIVLPVIEDALRDPRAAVRAAAARGLRLASGADVDRLLSATITSDRDTSVRASAIFAASFRHPLSPVIGEALLHAASGDPIEYVRSDAISVVRRNPDVSPRFAEVLASIAEHDSKPGIRRLALEALSSVSGQQ